MPLTNYNTLSRVRAIVDESSIERNTGGQIDWASITADADGAKRVKAGAVMSRMASGKLQPRAFSKTITALSVAGNVATATLANHGFSVGETVTVSGASLSYANGSVVVLSVADANTFTYAAVGANASATGTILVSRVATEIIETDATDTNLAEAKTGYGSMVGGVLYESLLPDATGTPKVIPAQFKAELRAVGCTFKFQQYADSRAS